MSYATKANAAVIAEISESDIDDYHITSADNYIEAMLGRSFGTAVSNTHYIDIKGDEKTIQLPHWPIISITLFRDNQRESSYTDLVEDTDFAVDKQAGLIKLIHDEYNVLKGSTSLTVGEKTVKITYTWGYSSVPNAVSLFADWLVAWMAEIKKESGASKTTGGAVLRKLQIGDYQEAYDYGNTKIDKKYKNALAEMTSTLIANYKLYVDEGTESYHIHFFTT